MKRLLLLVPLGLLLAEGAWGQWVFHPVGTPQEGYHWVTRPIDDNTVWVAKDQGFARTTDGGATWQEGTISTAPTTYYVGDLAALDASFAWVAMYDGSGLTSGGVFATSDGGATWTRQPTAFDGSGGFANIVRFFDANNGICAGDARLNDNFEIYTTTDGGQAWARVPNAQLPPLPNPSHGEHFYVACRGDHGNCMWFATCQGRMIRTTDRGQTWAAFSVGSTTYGSLAFGDSLHGIFHPEGMKPMRTTDGGVTWNLLPMPNWIPAPPRSFSYYMATYVPGRPNTIVMEAEGSNGLDWEFMTVISTDGGDTWGRMDLADGNWPSFLQSGVGWMSGYVGIYKWASHTGRYIFRCAPSIRYAGVEVGITGVDEFVSIGNYGTEAITVSSLTFQGSGFSLVDEPPTPFELGPWEVLNVRIAPSPTTRGPMQDSLVIASNAINAPSIGVALTGKGLRFGDVEGGQYMYAVADSLYAVNPSTGIATLIGGLGVGLIGDLAVDPTTKTLYGVLAGSSTLARIDPIGIGGIQDVTIPAADISAIAFSPAGTLYGGTMQGTLLRIDPGSGDTAFVGTAAIQYASLAFSPSGELFASVRPPIFNKDAIYRIDTTSGSATLIGKTGDNAVTQSIAFAPSGEMYGLKGTGSQENKIIMIDPATGAGTEVGLTGISGLQAIAMINVVATSIEGGFSDEIPGKFDLSQNYPNPFNPTTTIEYTLPHAGYVTLKVYNVLGEEVASLVAGDHAAGTFTATWDATGMSSGVYFYRLTAGEYVQTRKMVLMR